VDALYEDTPVIIEWEGLRFHSTPSQRRKDAARFTRLVTARYMPLRFSWLDVTENFDEVERQIRKALRLPRPCR
jgi:very-short-patch-repair endonuclease